MTRFGTCSVCADVEPCPVVLGITLDRPDLWSQLTVDERGRCVRHFVLCSKCTLAVRELLAGRSAAHQDAT